MGSLTYENSCNCSQRHCGPHSVSGCAYDRSDRYGYGRDGYGYNRYNRNYGRNRDGWTATLTGTAIGIATSHTA
jgi:hypothetical protein